MKFTSTLLTALALIQGALALPRESSVNCPPEHFRTAENFELEAYMGKWYVQAQQETRYLKKERNFCVRAEYSILDSHTVKVFNYANDGEVNGKSAGGELRAVIKDASKPSQLSVGPKWLPNFLKGPYWVVHTSPVNPETKSYDYAIIVGGSPTKQNAENGKCYAGSSNPLNFNGNGEGLWLFTRQQVADPALVEMLTEKASSLGLDITKLNKVYQEGCNYQ